VSDQRGYLQPTGDSFRWPDVLDAWAYWEHTDPARKLPALLAPLRARSGKSPCDYFDADLKDAICAAVDGVDIENRSVDEDWTSASIIDAAVAEQCRRDGIMDATRLRTPARLQSLSRYRGKCDTRDTYFAEIRAIYNGVIKRTVV
jgi:hypothetical protein